MCASGFSSFVLAWSALIGHSQAILDVSHARHPIGNIFGKSLFAPTVDGPFQSHFATGHRNPDLATVDVRVIVQPVVDVVANPLVGALIMARLRSTMSVRLLVTFTLE